MHWKVIIQQKENLKSYWNDRPLFEKNQQLKQKLEEANQERDIYNLVGNVKRKI